MKTKVTDLLFETQGSAQAILDANDPGYVIIVDDKNVGSIYDERGYLVAIIGAEGDEDGVQ